MKVLASSVFIFGSLALILFWLWPGLPQSLPYIGFLIVVSSCFLFLIFLYHKKVRVYAREGWVNFEEKPWSYRFYFILILIFLFGLAIFCVSRIFEIN